ncbi:MAG: helix-turn-helix transcriptional regulator [Clostridia bacterium]|nr:helix-turn-helix transcriptional regulator [Clostridia bacterium]
MTQKEIKNFESSNHETFEKALETFEHSEEDKSRTLQRAAVYSYSKNSDMPILYRHYNHYHNDEKSITGYTNNHLDYYKLYVFVEGKIGMFITDQLYTSDFGKIISLCQNEDYMLFIYELENLEYYEFNFPGDFFEKIGKNSPFHKIFSADKLQFGNSVELSEENTEKLFRIFKKMDNVIEQNGEHKDFLLYSYTVQAMSLICEGTGGENNKTPLLTPLLKNALKYISDNILTINETKQIANHCNVSISYLCRMFKKHLGTSPVEYITSQKLSRAKYLLRNGCNVTESCYESGFKSYNYFITTFRKNIGMTPTEYQKSEMNED